MPCSKFRADTFDRCGVIKGIGYIVVGGGGLGQTAGQVEFDGLWRDEFAGINAHTGLDAQTFDKDEIHGGSQ